MAIHKVTSVYDAAAEMFLQPSFSVALGVATRDFSDAMADPKIAKHKADLILYHIGEFDTVSGLITPITPPVMVFKGVDIGD